MPALIAIGSIGGLPIISAQSALQEIAANGIDASSLAYKVNSYRCPIGEEAGVGYFLMLRRDVEVIARPPSGQTLPSLDLRIGAGANVLNFPGLIFVKAMRVIPGTSQDLNALYVVELADSRWLLSRKCLDTTPTTYGLRFNVRGKNGSDDDFLDETTQDDAGTPWTWAQIIEDIWGRNLTSLLGSYLASFVTTPTPALSSTPENLRYEGVSAWEALCDACRRVGLEMRYDPIGDRYSAIQPGDGASDPLPTSAPSLKWQGGPGDTLNALADRATLRSGNDLLLEDGEVIPGPVMFPTQVVVHFPVAHVTDDPTAEVFGIVGTLYGHRVGIGETTIDTGSGVYTNPSLQTFPTTSVDLFDPMPARYSEATEGADPTNQSELETRAIEVANAYYRSLVDNTPARWVFSGIRNFIPGPFVSEVIWRDYGDGWKTEVVRMQGPVSPEQWRAPVTVPPVIVQAFAEETKFGYATADFNLDGETVEALIPNGLVIEDHGYYLRKNVSGSYEVVNPTYMFVGKTSDGAVAQGTAGQVEVYTGTAPGSYAATGVTNSAIYNRMQASIGDDEWVECHYIDQQIAATESGLWEMHGEVSGGDGEPNLSGTADAYGYAGDTINFTVDGDTVPALITKGMCFSGATYRLVYVDDHYEVTDPCLRFRGTTTATIAAGSTSGDVQIDYWTGSAWADTGEDLTDVLNGLLVDIASSMTVLCEFVAPTYDRANIYQANWECPE